MLRQERRRPETTRKALEGLESSLVEMAVPADLSCVKCICVSSGRTV